jgi:hypothetical protein
MLVIIPSNKTIEEMINYFGADPLVKFADRNDQILLPF